MSDDTPAEIHFTWRRGYTYLVLGLTSAGVGVIIAKLTDNDALKWVAISLIVQNILTAGFYMGGASIVDYARLAAGWRGNRQQNEPKDNVE